MFFISKKEFEREVERRMESFMKDFHRNEEANRVWQRLEELDRRINRLEHPSDYAQIAKDLRFCSETGDIHRDAVEVVAADAIEELVAASPPALWTDEPIEGTEFMTHTQGGGKGFEIHFRTDSLEKYKAVQEECRRQIDHAKADPPKEVE